MPDDGSELQTVSNLKSTILRSSRPNSTPIRWTGTPGDQVDRHARTPVLVRVAALANLR